MSKESGQFSFENPVGQRIYRYGQGVMAYGMWWDVEGKKWVTEEVRQANTHLCYCSHANHVRTFKAFKRHLRKHPELSSVDEVCWCNRYMGHNVLFTSGPKDTHLARGHYNKTKLIQRREQ